MEQSILKSTKKILGVADDDSSFDLDIITHINSAFSTLNDVGVGPPLGFVIADDTPVWTDFLDNENESRLSKVQTVVFLHTKLLFDPPTSSYLLASTEKQLQEQLWRVSVNREDVEWIDPDPADVLLVDGGDPTGG